MYAIIGYTPHDGSPTVYFADTAKLVVYFVELLKKEGCEKVTVYNIFNNEVSLVSGDEIRPNG